MYIELADILSVKDKEQDVQAEIEMQHFVSVNGDYRIVKKAPFVMHFRNTNRKCFRLTMETSLTLQIPCGRCLTDVDYEMKIRVNREIDMNESENQEEAEEFFYVSDNKLDVEALVYNEILVNLPMKVLCSENCKGICNRCGANLNSQTCDCDRTELDPRMSKIRDIFNNFKEV